MSMEPEHHTHEPQVQPQIQEGSNGLTGYAAVKYGFIFLIVVAILWFLAAYLIPSFTN
ncbi:MAG: hypothetical protein ABI572_07590 [Actinomycetota bacterium]